MEIVGMKRGL